ncbi:MAG: NUDIX hydrolase [Clostridiales bacterium]|nr:NUDIX hydrolase [Clostridiales bacterium]
MILLKEFSEGVTAEEITSERNTARAFVVDKDKNIALIEYSGVRNGEDFAFFTTPGGGMEENETPETAVRREVLEEIGFECNILHEVGTIIDYYFDPKRKIITNYYIAEATNLKQISWTEREKQNIKNIIWVDIEAAEKILGGEALGQTGRIIQRRDLYALKEAGKYFERILER